MKTDNNYGFYKTDNGKPIEGFLGDEEKAKILFVLREPNDDHPEKFWFKEILSPSYEYANNDKGKEKRAATKYKHILGSFAAYFDTEIKKCAYINLHPEKGEKSKSTEYCATVKAINEKPTAELIKNRMNIIKNENIGSEVVITTFDIFDELAKKFDIKKETYFKYKDKEIYFKYKDKEIKSFEYANKTFIGFYHPCYGINKNAFCTMLGIENYPEV